MTELTNQEQVFHQAIGVIAGELHLDQSTLTLADGKQLKVSIPQRVRAKLEHEAPERRSGLWRVYPRTLRSGELHNVFIVSWVEEPAPLRFTIAGVITWQFDDRILVKIQPKKKGVKPFIVTVWGALPGSVKAGGEVWRVDCELQGDRLFLDSATKLLDREPKERSQQEQPKTASNPKPKKISKPEPKKLEPVVKQQLEPQVVDPAQPTMEQSKQPNSTEKPKKKLVFERR